MRESFLKNPKLDFNRFSLKIGGFQSFTSIDYPDHLSAVVFCQGCIWKCRYCHNPHLQSFSPKKNNLWDWKTILDLLKTREGLIDSVVFSGGEPLLQPHLLNAIYAVKRLNYKVGIHTGGASFRQFKKILPLVDWVGMDVKAPQDKYKRITRIKNSGEKAWESIRLLIKSGVLYELRTTIHSSLLNQEDLLRIAYKLHKWGANNYTLQGFREKGCNDETLLKNKNYLEIDQDFRNKLASLFDTVTFR